MSKPHSRVWVERSGQVGEIGLRIRHMCKVLNAQRVLAEPLDIEALLTMAAMHAKDLGVGRDRLTEIIAVVYGEQVVISPWSVQ